MNVIFNVDAKALEWVVCVWFAQDKVGIEEINNGVDQHSGNQKAFGLPDRTTAKIFVFRLIYGGSAWSYVFDPNFNWISKDPKWWQKVIDRFYEKYSGIKETHEKWVNEAVTTGRLVMPTGRTYEFEPYSNPHGGLKWPRTQILNYPVQGLACDLVTIARISLYRRVKSKWGDLVKFISTVHDSIVMVLDEKLVGEMLSLTTSVFDDVPRNFNKLFGHSFNLPLRAECSVGPNMKDLIAV